MALIKCTECNNKFSEYANACPNCMCPIEIVNKNILIKKKNNIKKQLILFQIIKKIKDLKKVKEIFNSLNNFRDSSKKIKEIDGLLKIKNEYQKRKIKQITKKIVLIFILISLCIFFQCFDIGQNNGKLVFCTKNDYDCLYGNYSSKELDNLYEKEINKLVDILKKNNYISDRKDRIQVMKKEINNSIQYLNQYYRNDESDISFEYYSELLNNKFLSILDKLKVEKNLLECNDCRLEYNILKNEINFSCVYGSRWLSYNKNYNTNSFGASIRDANQYFFRFNDFDTELIYECIHTEIDKFLRDVLYYIDKSNINIKLLKFLKEKESLDIQEQEEIEGPTYSICGKVNGTATFEYLIDGGELIFDVKKYYE